MPDGVPPSQLNLQLAFRVEHDVANKLYAVKQAIEQQKLEGSKLPLSMVCKIALVMGLTVMMEQYGIKDESAPPQTSSRPRRPRRSRQGG